MQIRAALLSAFSALLLITPQAARAADAGVVVSATMRPKSVSFADFKANRGPNIIVTYTLENRTAQTQVVNGFCTVRISLTCNGNIITMEDKGNDAARRMDPSDVIVIKPGKKATLTVRLILFQTPKGILVLRYDEGGGDWEGGPIPAPGPVDLNATYLNSLKKAELEKIAPKLAGTQYSLPELQMPVVRFSITK